MLAQNDVSDVDVTAGIFSKMFLICQNSILCQETP